MLPRDDPEETRIRANVKVKFAKFRDQGLGIRDIVHLFDAELVRAHNVLTAKGLAPDEVEQRVARSSGIIDFELNIWCGVGDNGSMVAHTGGLSFSGPSNPTMQGNLPLSPTRSPSGTLRWPEGTPAAQPIQYLPIQSPYIVRSPSTEQSLVNQNTVAENYRHAVVKLLDKIDGLMAQYHDVNLFPRNVPEDIRAIAQAYFYSRDNIGLYYQIREYLKLNDARNITSLSMMQEEGIIGGVFSGRPNTAE